MRTFPILIVTALIAGVGCQSSGPATQEITVGRTKALIPATWTSRSDGAATMCRPATQADDEALWINFIDAKPSSGQSVADMIGLMEPMYEDLMKAQFQANPAAIVIKPANGYQSASI